MDAGLFYLFLDFLHGASLSMVRLHSVWFADYVDGPTVSWFSVAKFRHSRSQGRRRVRGHRLVQNEVRAFQLPYNSSFSQEPTLFLAVYAHTFRLVFYLFSALPFMEGWRMTLAIRGKPIPPRLFKLRGSASLQGLSLSSLHIHSTIQVHHPSQAQVSAPLMLGLPYQAQPHIL